MSLVLGWFSSINWLCSQLHYVSGTKVVNSISPFVRAQPYRYSESKNKRLQNGSCSWKQAGIYVSCRENLVPTARPHLKIQTNLQDHIQNRSWAPEHEEHNTTELNANLGLTKSFDRGTMYRMDAAGKYTYPLVFQNHWLVLSFGIPLSTARRNDLILMQSDL